MFCARSPDRAIDVCWSLGLSRDALELGHTGRSMVAVWIHHFVSILGGIGIGVHELAYWFGIFGCVPKRRIHCSQRLYQYSEREKIAHTRNWQ